MMLPKASKRKQAADAQSFIVVRPRFPHGFLSHSGFRSASDPTSQPHVSAFDRSAARYTCYAQRNGPIPPRLSIRLGSKVPA
jgi:hypothetical protein